MWSSLKNSSDAAQLFCRAVLGLLLICFHAWPRLLHAVNLWSHHGAHHSAWMAGFWVLVAVAETLASILLIVGLWTRPACLVFALLLGWLLFSALQGHGGIGSSESTIELFLFIVLLFFVGPGRFSFDKA